MNPLGILIIAATTLFPAYQLFMLPNVTDQIALFSQYLGIAALILMAWGQILSTRIAGVEAVFGGLDRGYVLHKWLGIGRRHRFGRQSDAVAFRLRRLSGNSGACRLRR